VQTLRAAYVSDAQKRFDVVRLEGKGLVVKSERLLDIPGFSQLSIGKVPQKADLPRGEPDGLFEMVESFIRLLQEAK